MYRVYIFECVIYIHMNVQVGFIYWQNFLFTKRDENAPLKVIDFGLSDFIRPGKVSKFVYLILTTLIYRFSL